MSLYTRRELLAALGAIAAASAVDGFATDAFAKKPRKTHVEWTDVVLPEDERKGVRTAILKSVLKKESRRVDWGEYADGKLEASVKVIEFTVSRKEDVVRVTCTAMGKLGKGPSVRTHFSFGGHPHEQAKLEQTMLTLIAQGVITRLASIARGRAKRHAAG